MKESKKDIKRKKEKKIGNWDAEKDEDKILERKTEMKEMNKNHWRNEKLWCRERYETWLLARKKNQWIVRKSETEL